VFTYIGNKIVEIDIKTRVVTDNQRTSISDLHTFAWGGSGEGRIETSVGLWAFGQKNQNLKINKSNNNTKIKITFQEKNFLLS
jgi:hypothetical protein